eukprot:TRINITY_DN2925_c0_g1_i1.p2 TRINITY_DN2925_c0_g1~~TRINITY_DN2925_c0_g1_i1.p2  ORF type:complete len:168 (-),score=57.32 TRINITY_DN2925_c0_g1_i1:22-525(-)
MSVGDEGLEPIHEDDAEDEAASAPQGGEEEDAEGDYEDEEFDDDDNQYAGMEVVPADENGTASPVPGEEEEKEEEMTEKERDVKELMDLQRKYRMMMGDRSSFQKHANSKIRQQNTHLGRLQNENQSMKKELGVHQPRQGERACLLYTSDAADDLLCGDICRCAMLQ